MLQRRFQVPLDRTRFIPWPVLPEVLPESPDEGDYVYSAGWAHRDWPTLVRALETVPVPAILAPGRSLDIPTNLLDRIRVRPTMPSPEDGRALCRGAKIVAVIMRDTELPSGPLVLLDAMAAGKPVVATSANGTRDYITDRVTGLVVPPDDSAALSEALRELSVDEELRRSLGRAARRYVAETNSLEKFWFNLRNALPPNHDLE
ncbi:hypothetical protein GCM10011492_31070 [Flexivirga endophytica]|uniref:Glycosyl transferase family 1 domain-containing protein n=2 Tax=Flexivirga endophytica TaxID=1849103 RepID=A0A916WXG2_9MICO|nr:hypothetical protein GCM10011492_31070 [Flexivirga endophytica]GHB46100.1 hypothetical protein GCM10008112_13460 [Flexivirga endophytica]